jgi:hypothetical protein
VVALGLLAGVMISAAGVMVVATRYVKSGRSGSVALSVARDATEEIDGWPFHHVLDELQCDPALAVCNVDFGNPTPAVAAWKQQLQQLSPEAEMALELTPLDEAGSLGAASALRIEIRIGWSDGPRAREIALVAVRM